MSKVKMTCICGRHITIHLRRGNQLMLNPRKESRTVRGLAVPLSVRRLEL
jgi:hypothetical protein